MSNMRYIRAKGTMTMGNLAKAVNKMWHGYFLSNLYLVIFPRLYRIPCLNLLGSSTII